MIGLVVLSGVTLLRVLCMLKDKRTKASKYSIFLFLSLYILRRYRRELSRKIRYAIIIILVLAYVIYPQIQIYSYYLGKILVLQNAGYDILISAASGPNIAWNTSKGNITYIFNTYIFNNSKSYITEHAREITSFYAIASYNGKNVSIPDVLITDNKTAYGDLAPFGKSWLISGSFEGDGMIIDEYFARRLGVKVGDMISLNVNTKSSVVSEKVKIIGIVATPVAIHGGVVTCKDIPGICSKISIEKVLNIDYQSYIKSLNVDKTLMYLRSVNGSNGLPFLAISMKDDEIDKESRILSEVINVPGYYIFVYGSFLVVGLIFYKELDGTFNERKKSLAILGSLGVTFRSLIGVIIIEALAYMLVLVTLSVFLTLFIFVLIYGYQPSWVVMFWPLMMTYLVSTIFSLIAAIPIIIKAKRLSVMHLLSEV